MKTLLFYPRIENAFRPSNVPLGLLSIATVLKQNGHNPIICDRYFESESVEVMLDNYKPDIVGVSIISHTFLDDSIKICKVAKERGIPVIVGGSFASAIDKVILESGLVDFVSLNEGEFTWLEIAEAYDNNESFYSIKGLSYIKDGCYIKTESRDFIDLTTLPELDWSLVEPQRYFQKTYGANKMISMYSSKGCGGRCSYCYNPGFHQSTRRCRNFETVFEEMKMLVEKYGADAFDFTDDVLFANRNEAIEFCKKLLEKKFKVYWSGYLKVGVLNSLEDYNLLYRAGCRSLIFGIESGSEKILKSVNKNQRLDKAESNIDFCNKAGIVPITMFILGFPDEDENDIKTTLDFARVLKNRGGVVVYSFFTPLPGSKIFYELIESKQMSEPANLYEYAKIRELEDLFINFTKVPTKDLIVIRKFIRLKGIFSNNNSSSTNNQIIKVFLSTAKVWFERGPFHFIKSFFYTTFSFISLFSVFFNPSVRKKYELYFTERD